MKSENWLPTLWGERSDTSDPFASMRRQMEELFQDFGAPMRRGALTTNGTLTPRMDVSETDKELRITAELPGVQQKDISVTLTGDMLTIAGEKRSEQKVNSGDTKSGDKEPTWHRVERTYGSFQRTMTVPYEIDPAKVDAKFKDGILTVTLPKPAEIQAQSRQIEIRSAA